MLNPLLDQSFPDANNEKLDWMAFFHRMLLVVAIAIMSALCVPLMWPFLSQAIVIGSCVCAAAAFIGCKVIEWKAGSVLLVFDSEMGGVARSPTLIKQWVEAMDARITDNLKQDQIAIRFRVFGGPPIIYMWGNACRGYVWAFENLRFMRWLPGVLAVKCKFIPKYSGSYTEDIEVSELTNIFCEAHEEILVPPVAYRGGSRVTDRLRDLLSGRTVVCQSNLRSYYREANAHVRALLAKNAVAVSEETVENERLLTLELYVQELVRLEGLYCIFRKTNRLAHSIEGVAFANQLLNAIRVSNQQLGEIRLGLSQQVRHVVMLRLNQLRDGANQVNVLAEKQLLDDVRTTLVSKEKMKPQ
jgi:hypothetical protein